MLIAQITDIHLGFEPNNPAEFNRKRLDQTLRHLADLKPRPDLLLVTGDLADTGDDSVSYKRLRGALAHFPIPSYFCLGNHDSRPAFRRYFPEVPQADGFIQYALDDHPLRILVLDTLEDGRHGGGFCEVRAAWLAARLAEAPERPTLVALHHPPIDTGLSWMSESEDAGWIRRLHAIVSARTNIVGLVAGHLHRPITARWAGTTISVCASIAPGVALDLLPIDKDKPDGRPMIVADPPGYALHLWTGTTLISHQDTADDHTVLARFEPALQPLVQLLKAERGEG
jgi:3',5'-cyclic AMP phosphodiesterase CpdA